MAAKRQSFSVVTPNLNMGNYLKDTIESVLGNLEPGDEYFVIDGGSTDNSVEIIRSHEKQLAGWVSEQDSGYADAIAKGFRLAKNPLLCWINSGDLLLGGALDKARQAFGEMPADLIFGDDFYIDDESLVIFHSKGRVRSLRNMMLYGGWTPLQDACFWRRSLYEKVGGMNVNLRHAADYDLFLRCALDGDCEYTPYTFSAFRRHEGQKSIATARSYVEERETCRRMALRDQGRSSVGSYVLGPYYWAVVRFRAHVLNRCRRRSPLSGMPVSSLKCGRYS